MSNELLQDRNFVICSIWDLANKFVCVLYEKLSTDVTNKYTCLHLWTPLRKTKRFGSAYSRH